LLETEGNQRRATGMNQSLTSPYLERIRREKAAAETEAGTIHISDTEKLIPIGRNAYAHVTLPPKHVLDKATIPIIYKRPVQP
jgi:hypothetical protein